LNTSPPESQDTSALSNPLPDPYLMQDAEFRTHVQPISYNAIGGYLGGSAANVWSDADFWSLPHDVRRLPIWVGAVGAVARTDPEKDAHDAIARLRHLTVPPHRIVAIDMEESTDRLYVEVFGAYLRLADYYVWTYATLSNYQALPVLDGYWIAHPEPRPVKPQIPSEVARQYGFSGQTDESVIFGGEQFRRMW